MPRANREFEVGGIYHVLNRGVEKRKIFLKNQDYERFIIGLEFYNSHDPTNLWPLLAKVGSDPTIGPSVGERLALQRSKGKERIVDILAFVLMPNHFHFILREIQEAGISSFMQKMGGYSVYFNKQYERIGPLFQSRYKVVPMKSDGQLDVLFTYVHTNPVELIEPLWKKENKVRNAQKAISWLAGYRWSSYPDYIGKQKFPMMIERDFFLERLGGPRGCAKEVIDWIKHKAEMAILNEKEFE